MQKQIGERLVYAAGSGDVGRLQKLLGKTTLVDWRSESGETPLIIAASKGFLNVALLLVENGADVKAKDRDGATALKRAPRKGHKEVVKILASRGTR